MYITAPKSVSSSSPSTVLDTGSGEVGVADRLLACRCWHCWWERSRKKGDREPLTLPPDMTRVGASLLSHQPRKAGLSPRTPSTVRFVFTKRNASLGFLCVFKEIFFADHTEAAFRRVNKRKRHLTITFGGILVGMPRVTSAWQIALRLKKQFLYGKVTGNSYTVHNCTH